MIEWSSSVYLVVNKPPASLHALQQEQVVLESDFKGSRTPTCSFFFPSRTRLHGLHNSADVSKTLETHRTGG